MNDETMMEEGCLPHLVLRFSFSGLNGKHRDKVSQSFSLNNRSLEKRTGSEVNEV